MTITNLLPTDSSPLMARLQIHAPDELCAADSTFIKTVRHLLSICSHGRMPCERACISLDIRDAHGLRVFSLDDAGPLVDVPLPAGTYHVAVHVAQIERGYTMTLVQGSLVNLYLGIALDQQR